MKKIRIGMVNWDASLSKDTYFGFYQLRSLSPAKYRTWVPFYADILGENKIDYHWRTVEEYERELKYAVDAGIDYFAFVWYPTEGSLEHIQRSPKDCSHRVHELNYARRLYEKSSFTDKIGMCAIMGAHTFTDCDIEELADAFTKPYYEKIDGRPILYIYNEYNENIIKRVHAVCQRRGIPTPFTVPFFNIPQNYNFPIEAPLADAVSAYCVLSQENFSSFKELCDLAIENDCIRLRQGEKIVPMFSVGWDPSPRIDRPTPWNTREDGSSTYAYVTYAPHPTAEDLINGAKAFAEHIKTNVKDKFAGHILSFAWNEFEEGSYVCPTYRRDGSIDESQVSAFAKAAEVLRSELEEE
ncbi:MAG: hypothetical protein J6L83_02070 [Clostridia bacterium]|nr:hypothetical protein [Clostridia bacterium]